MSRPCTARAAQGARRLPASLVLLALLAACAAAPTPAPERPPRNVFILLPDEQGKAGALVVSGGGTERILDRPRQAVRIAPGAAPGAPFVMSDLEVESLFGPAISALPRAPAQFMLYFRKDSSELADESAGRIGEIVRAVRERASVDVSVVGHADTLGDRDYNRQLSLKRARAVADRLVAEGVSASILEIASHGKDNPLIPTGDQVSEPRNRRVEVTVR